MKDLASRILYEDNHLLVINKMPGEICQGDKTGDEPLPEAIKAWIKIRDAKPGNVFLGVVHRLDRPVSGAVIFAKTSKALERMNEALRDRTIEKTYFAVVAKRPDPASGTLEHILLKDQAQNKSRVVKSESPEARKAILHYTLRASLERYHLLEITLETGRHHQIRAQLAAIGSPVRGDLKYGSPRSNPDGSISLHASRIRFSHPARKEMVEVKAPPPPGDPVWKLLTSALEGS